MKNRKTLHPFLLIVFLLSLCLVSVSASAKVSRYYGSRLKGNAKAVYLDLVERYSDGELDPEDGSSLKFSYWLDEVEEGFSAFWYDYPEIYWLQGIGRYETFSWGGEDPEVTLYPVYYYPDIKNDIPDAEKAVRSMLKAAAGKKTRMEKIRAFHDVIIKNCRYEKTIADGQCLISGLLSKYENSFVCAGYARLFQLLCVKSDIPCIYADGGIGSEKAAHAWNYVQLENGKWYLLDVTLDHPFLVTDGNREQIRTYENFLRGQEDDEKYGEQTRHYAASVFQMMSFSLPRTYPVLSKTSVYLMEECKSDPIDVQTYTGKAVKPSLRISSAQMMHERTLKEGKDYKITWKNNKKAGTASAVLTGIGNYSGTKKITFKIAKPASLSKGAEFTSDGYRYVVTKKGKEVSCTGQTKQTKKIQIPATVKMNGKKYLVTGITDGAFKGSKKAVQLSIGKNVKKIGKNAFFGCKKLKKITIKTKRLSKKTVSAGAFGGLKAKVTVLTPSGKKSSYRKILTAAGLGKKAVFQ